MLRDRLRIPAVLTPRSVSLIAFAGLMLILAIEPAAAQAFEGPEGVTEFLRSFFEWGFTVGVLACAGIAVLCIFAYGASGKYLRRAKIAGGAAVGGYLVFLIINSALTAFGFTALDFAPV